MIIFRRFGFDAAHCIPSHPGRCHFPHGHHWRVEVAVKGNFEEEDSMLIDFGDLKKILMREVIDRLDHTDLNDIFEFEPTAENLAVWIRRQIEYYLPENILIHFVRVWESEDCYAQVGDE